MRRFWETDQRFANSDEWKGDLIDRMSRNPDIQCKRSFKEEWHAMLRLEEQERFDSQPESAPAIPEVTPAPAQPTPSEQTKALEGRKPYRRKGKML